MTKYRLAAASFLLAVCMPFMNGGTLGNAQAGGAPASGQHERAKSPKADAAEIPAEISFPSTVGEVNFQHMTHIKDRGIKCVECHHQINAKTLHTPHPDYLQSSWINCKTCHNESATKVKQQIFACSACHPITPSNIADESLSAKVVTHRQCWKCHDVATGKNASNGCQLCHSGRKSS